MSLCNDIKNGNLWCKALDVHRQQISLSSTIYQKLWSEIHNYNKMLIKDTTIDGLPFQFLLSFVFHLTLANGSRYS